MTNILATPIFSHKASNNIYFLFYTATSAPFLGFVHQGIRIRILCINNYSEFQIVYKGI